MEYRLFISHIINNKLCNIVTQAFPIILLKRLKVRLQIYITIVTVFVRLQDLFEKSIRFDISEDKSQIDSKGMWQSRRNMSNGKLGNHRTIIRIIGLQRNRTNVQPRKSRVELLQHSLATNIAIRLSLSSYHLHIIQKQVSLSFSLVEEYRGRLLLVASAGLRAPEEVLCGAPEPALPAAAQELLSTSLGR